MLIRSALVLALVVPCVASAQTRAPIFGGGRRPTAAPLGPQPEPIARAVRIQRSKVSIEAYPMISRVQAPSSVAGVPPTSWTTFGSGTRADYRLARTLSWTMDVTSSYLGGPSITETVETGFRLHSGDWGNRFRPYVDARVGFEHAYDNYLSPTELGIGPASQFAAVSRYSRGFGGLVGAGAEYSLTNTFALTGGVAAMRTNMTAYRFDAISIPSVDDRFRMTTYRLTLGIKYNPVHLITAANSERSVRDTP